MDLHEREKHTPISYPHDWAPSNPGVITGQPNAVFNLTDLGNSNRFVEQYRNVIKYCSTSRTWFAWNGKYWQKDENAIVARLIREVVKSLYNEAQQAEDEVTRAKIAKHAMASEHVNRIRAIEALAKDDQRIRICATAFDTNDSLLNCNNGTLDLRTGQLKPHDPNDLITKIVHVDYDPNSTCPNFEQFILQIMAGNERDVIYLQRLFG